MKNSPKTGITCEQLFGLYPDPGVYVLTGEVADTALALMSEREADFVVDAVLKRRREFATARALAREGLERFFDLRDFDLLNDEKRAPVWPPGITGSLSHSSTRAWAALVDAGYGSIGIDGENRDGLARKLWHLILRDEEIAYIETLEASMQKRRALVIYSAKESLFKAQFPLTRKFVEFKAVQVRLDEDGSFQCIFEKDFAPIPRGFVAHGRWSDETEVLTTVGIPSHSNAA